MTGFSMKVHANLILAESNHLRNIRKVFEMAKLSEPTVVLGALASVETVTNEDERKLGCIVIDIGEGTSDITIYQHTFLRSYLCIPKGGLLISQDIAVGLRTPPVSAENIKIDYGNVFPATVDQNKSIDVEGIGGRENQQKQLSLIAQITHIRAKEILDTCYKETLSEFTDMDSLTAGVALTGGTALLENIQFLVEDEAVFNLPCKIAYPNCKGLSGAISLLDNPKFSCIVGLLYYAAKSDSAKPKTKAETLIPPPVKNFFKDLYKKIKEL
jgi:cell division protein FtsA